MRAWMLALACAGGWAAPARAQEVPDNAPPLPPVAELIQKLPLDRSDEAEVTVWQLCRHGAAAAGPLGEALNSGGVKQRMRAAAALAGLRGDAKTATAALLKAVQWQPPKGAEGGPGELATLRVNVWRALSIVGGPPAASAAKSAVAKALQAAVARYKQDPKKADGDVPGWVGAAIGCWLYQGGPGAPAAISRQLLAVLKTPMPAMPFIRAIGDARHPGLVPVLTAAIEFEERDAAAMRIRNEQRRIKAERLQKDPPPDELSGPERTVAHQVLFQATGKREPAAAGWGVWWKGRRAWLYWSGAHGALKVDEAAKQAGAKSSAAYRKDHPWAEGEGPFLAPDTPRFGGALPRRRADEEPGELPGGG